MGERGQKDGPKTQEPDKTTGDKLRLDSDG
jgi:hypothetical protein